MPSVYLRVVCMPSVYLRVGIPPGIPLRVGYPSWFMLSGCGYSLSDTSGWVIPSQIPQGVVNPLLLLLLGVVNPLLLLLLGVGYSPGLYPGWVIPSWFIPWVGYSCPDSYSRVG